MRISELFFRKLSLMSLMDFKNDTEIVAMIDPKPTALQTWGIGLTIVTITAFGPSICIIIVPFLSKTLYELFMTFLVAFGVGTLSGSTLYVLLPGALGLDVAKQSYYRIKISIILVVLYAFFSVDRILAYVLHFRKIRSKGQKVHQSTLDKILKKDKHRNEVTSMDDNPAMSRIILTSENRNNNKDNDMEYYELEKERLKNEFEAAVVSNMLLRKMSCKHQSTLLTILDDNKTSAENSPDHKIKDPNDELAVNVEIVEEKILDPSDLDVATVAWMIMFGSLVNNFLDGMSNGVAFANSLTRGFSVGIAVITQQLPQETGTLAILIQSGLGFKRTLLLNLFPNSLSYLGFIIGVLIGNADDSYGNYVFAVSSGMYLYVFLGTLIPEIRDSINEQIKVDLKRSIRSTALQAIGIAAGANLMYLICAMMTCMCICVSCVYTNTYVFINMHPEYVNARSMQKVKQ
ncbi:Metal cation symporter ZIP14 [Dirofilaria immitis]